MKLDVSEKWNKFTNEIYNEWRELQLENASRTKGEKSQELLEKNTDDRYSYRAFIASETNSELVSLAKAGIFSVASDRKSKSVVVLDDGETWSSVNESKIIVMNDNVDYTGIGDLQELFEVIEIESENYSNRKSSFIELDLKEVLDFYLSNTDILNELDGIS